MPYRHIQERREYQREYQKRWRKENPERYAEITATSTRKWVQANKAKIVDARLKRIYGISSAEWNTLFEAQGRCCALCGENNPPHKRKWHTDHDHATGKVRAILCMDCNMNIGRVEKIGLHRAQLYLSGMRLDDPSMMLGFGG